MSKVTSTVTIAALGVVLMSACHQESAAAPVDVRAAMQQKVNPAVTAVWDIGNNALNDEGLFDAKLVDEAEWTELIDSASQLSAAAKTLSAGTSFIASAPDNAEVAAGEIAMAQVQKHLDADPQGFAKMAAGLAAHADKLVAAAKAKDAAAVGDLVGEIDQVCESCHLEYWYPEQRAATAAQ